MNVNRIGFNPNFGMAMRIKKQAMQELERLPEDRLQEVRQVGEDHKDDKFIDIIVPTSIYSPIIAYKKAGNAYSGLYLEELPFPTKELRLKGEWASETCGPRPGEKVTYTIVYDTKEDAAAARKRIKDSVGFSRTSEIAKEMEKYLAKKNGTQVSEQNKKQRQAEIAKELFAEFGDEEEDF